MTRLFSHQIRRTYLVKEAKQKEKKYSFYDEDNWGLCKMFPPYAELLQRHRGIGIGWFFSFHLGDSLPWEM